MKYLSFSGVSTRSEYWAVQLIGWLLGSMIFFVAALAFTAFASITAIVVGVLVALVVVWAGCATMARRFRDAGVNPWWTLAYVVPYVGVVVFIVAGCLATERKLDE